MKSRSALIFAVLLISTCLGSITFGNSMTRKENGVESTTRIVPDNYPSIQAAIYASSAGDQIMVRNGTYIERVTVNQTVSIFAEYERGAKVDGLNAGTIFTVVTKNISIANFTIQNAGSSGYGVYLNNVTGCIVRKNLFVNNLIGVSIAIASSNNFVSYNDVSSPISNSRGIEIGSSTSNSVFNNSVHENQNGIRLASSSLNNVTQNLLLANRDNGILIESGSTNNTIASNVVVNSTNTGINIVSSNGNVVSANDIKSASVSNGMRFAYSANNTVISNTVHENTQGIVLSWSSYNNVTKNIIMANRDNGIIIDRPYPQWSGDSLYNKIVANNITKNSYGIKMEATWSQVYPISNNTLYHNNLDNNTNGQVRFSLYVASNTWDNGYPLPEGGGNYWSDYKIKYPNAQPRPDGKIWDTPYVLDVNNIDRYPLMNVSRWWEDRIPTKIYLDLNPNPASIGQTVTLIGNLTTEDNLPIGGASVTLKVNGGSSRTLSTNATGWFKASGQVGSGGTFNVSATYAGSSQYMPCSSWKILTVKTPTEIFAKFFTNLVSPGATVTLKGILLDQSSHPIKSATVSLQYSNDYGLNWTQLGTVSTDSYGIFSKTYPAPSIGTYIYRMNYTGSSTYMPCTTDITLVVR